MHFDAEAGNTPVSGLRPFYSLLEALPVGAFLCDANGGITYFNAEAARIWGAQPTLHDRGARFWQSLKLSLPDGSPVELGRSWPASQSHKTGQTPPQREIVIERRDGSIAIILASSKPIWNDAGSLVGTVNLMVDISQRKQAEQSHAFQAAIVDSSDDAIVSKTLDGHILTWNAGAERIFGYRAEEAIGRPITMIIPANRWDDEHTILSKIRSGQRVQAFETVRLTKDGRRLDVSLSISPVYDEKGHIVGASKVARDISLQKQAERALRESEQRFSRFMQYLPGLAWIKDANGRYLFANEAAARVFGMPHDQIVGKRDADIFSPETAAAFSENDRRALVDESGIETVESLLQADGMHHSLVAKFPIPGAEGEPAMVGGVAIDITDRIEAETALRASEERFRALAENAPAAIFIKDCEGRYTLANRLACQALGRREGPIGFTDHELMPAKLADRIRQHDLEVISTGRTSQNEELVQGAGEPRAFLSVKFPLFDPAGMTVGVCGVAIDVTERKQNAEALLMVKNELADQLSDLSMLHEMSMRLATTPELQPVLEETLRTAVALQDGEMGIISLGEAESAALQVRASLGFDDKFLRDLGSVQPRVGPAGECFAEARRVIIEDTETVAVGSDYRELARRAGFRAVHNTPLVTRAGTVVGVLSAHFRQPHRPSDRELHLIDLCCRQAVDFIENARLYEQLRDADRRKDEFLAMLAHELRNPLAPISHSLQILRMTEDLPPAVGRVCEVMERQAHHMTRLVDDLLEVSRITRGKIELRTAPVELSSIIAGAVETSRPLIDQLQHQFAVSLPPEPLMLEADAVRLGQVIANLLNNAAKYTPPGGQIGLHVRREGGEAVIAVRDSGRGISPEMLPRVFDLFTQADQSPERSPGGLGIGLTLAKRLVEMHSGVITAHSEGIGQGSQFVVRLPVSAVPVRRPAMAAPQTRSRSPDRPKLRILAVDDLRDSLYIMGRLLTSMGQEVQTAGDGPDVLKRVGEHPFDVIISDIGMPDMDGYELARRLRAMPEAEGVILVALTGFGQENDRQRTKEAGFDYHLVKPVSIDALESLLDSIAARSSPLPR